MAPSDNDIRTGSTTAPYNKNQYVGDNIDLNIVSINGNTPFHAMGMIKVTSEREKTENRKGNWDTLSLGHASGRHSF